MHENIILVLLTSITQLFGDVESTLQKNFNPERVARLSKIIDEFYSVKQVTQNLANRLVGGHGINGDLFII